LRESGVPGACVFDAYGTLFDFASAAARCGASLGAKRDALTALWRDKQLQYTWLRSLQGNFVDFWRVTTDALDFALESLELDGVGLRSALLDAYLTLDVFPEVPAVLAKLREQGIKTAILSNGTREMLRAAVSNARIEPLLDAVLSVDEVAVYKPHPKVYQLAVDRMGVEAGAILFHSSNAWDAWSASAFGMRVVWCNRHSQMPERLPGHPDYEVRALADLPFIAGR
jgi:2-haloacid dehalogenase